MRVNLVIADNGAGLTRDMHLLAGALAEAGMDITITALRRGKLRKWFRPWFVRAGNLAASPFGTQAAVSPEPDAGAHPCRIPAMGRDQRAGAHIRNTCCSRTSPCCSGWTACSSRPGMPRKSLTRLGSRTEYIGFTSEDRLRRPRCQRERAFLHVAGKSGNKGTQAVLAAWRQHPHWPPLTMVQRSRRPPAERSRSANVILLYRIRGRRRTQRACRTRIASICARRHRGIRALPRGSARRGRGDSRPRTERR